jgi:hypothetical protein
LSVQSLCWSQPCQQFLGRSKDGPPGSEKAESLLNLPDCFHFGISKLLAKLDAIPLLHVFSHYWAKCNETSTYYSTSHISCLGEKDAPGKAGKNHACAGRSTPPLWSYLPTFCHWFFREKNKVGYFLNRVVVQWWVNNDRGRSMQKRKTANWD